MEMRHVLCVLLCSVFSGVIFAAKCFSSKEIPASPVIDFDSPLRKRSDLTTFPSTGSVDELGCLCSRTSSFYGEQHPTTPNQQNSRITFAVIAARYNLDCHPTTPVGDDHGTSPVKNPMYDHGTSPVKGMVSNCDHGTSPVKGMVRENKASWLRYAACRSSSRGRG